MMNEKVLDALLSINVPLDKARAAAISLAEYEPQLSKIEGDIAGIKNELTTIKWLMGGQFTLTVGILLRLLIT